MNPQQPTGSTLLEYLSALIDKNGGLKTTVVVQLASDSLLQAALLLLSVGIGIALVAHLLKNVITNKQQTAMLHELQQLTLK